MVSGIINDTFNQTRSKAINMGFYWFMDQNAACGWGWGLREINYHALKYSVSDNAKIKKMQSRSNHYDNRRLDSTT